MLMPSRTTAAKCPSLSDPEGSRKRYHTATRKRYICLDLHLQVSMCIFVCIYTITTCVIYIYLSLSLSFTVISIFILIFIITVYLQKTYVCTHCELCTYMHMTYVRCVYIYIRTHADLLHARARVPSASTLYWFLGSWCIAPRPTTTRRSGQASKFAPVPCAADAASAFA